MIYNDTSFSIPFMILRMLQRTDPNHYAVRGTALRIVPESDVRLACRLHYRRIGVAFAFSPPRVDGIDENLAP